MNKLDPNLHRQFLISYINKRDDDVRREEMREKSCTQVYLCIYLACIKLYKR